MTILDPRATRRAPPCITKEGLDRGASVIKKRVPLGPYRGPLPRLLQRVLGGWARYPCRAYGLQAKREQLERF